MLNYPTKKKPQKTSLNQKLDGKSIYANNTTDSIATSWTSSTDRAIGLHIYGSNNDVTLNSGANITANGSYSMGVRVDGAGNTLTINDDVKITVGDDNQKDVDNYGISVNYGKTVEMLPKEEKSFWQKLFGDD